MALSTVTEASGKRIYAIGDLHGCPDEPAVLLRYLEDEEGLQEDDLVIFLGDYIDRGPDSKGTIELLLEFKQRFPRTRFLKGNHEDMLLDFIGFGGKLGSAFLYNGGVETIQSYGMSVFHSPEEIVASFPPAHFKFLCDLESIIKIADDYVLCHAGLNFTQDLYHQQTDDTFWIREAFVSEVHSLPFAIVFGHTPHEEIFLHLPYKIGLDTGLVFGNKLSCLELTGGKLLQVHFGDKEVKPSKVIMKPSMFSFFRT